MILKIKSELEIKNECKVRPTLKENFLFDIDEFSLARKDYIGLIFETLSCTNTGKPIIKINNTIGGVSEVWLEKRQYLSCLKDK